MKKKINGITYNSDTGKVVKSRTFKDGLGGRILYIGTRGKAKGKYFIVTWQHPYYTEIGLKECDKADIEGYIWD